MQVHTHEFIRSIKRNVVPETRILDTTFLVYTYEAHAYEKYFTEPSETLVYLNNIPVSLKVKAIGRSSRLRGKCC